MIMLINLLPLWVLRLSPPLVPNGHFRQGQCGMEERREAITSAWSRTQVLTLSGASASAKICATTRARALIAIFIAEISLSISSRK